eukprot:TRINITY_DN7585_c0_g1_i3.p1 TRINITY_DN7585_c0_g1~~TRINITY_DN7585_c0_g1_i3.p1  ORF type:complete len:488 (-),score=121.33 TRINITY_DN7585_c0_g1_i3:1086-2438(-)
MSTAFFPQVAQSQFGITDAFIGVVFAVLPAVVSVCSPVAAYICQTMGRMPVLCVGTFVEVIGAVMFGFSRSFVTFVISRAITGVGAACTSVSSMALLVSNVENLNDALGLQEILSGLGFMLGAPIGAGLFSLLGFQWVFFFNGIVLAAMLVYALLEWRVNVKKWEMFEADKVAPSEGDSGGGEEIGFVAEDEEKPQEELTDEQRAALPQMPTLMLLDRAVAPTAISCSVLFLILAATEPIFAPHIQELLNLKTSIVGLLYALPSIMYAIFAGFAGEVSRRITGKTTLALGLFLMTLSSFLCGPAPYLDTINSLGASWTFLLSGFLIMGIGLALGFVPGVPLMREGADRRAYLNRNKFKAEEKFLSNFVSGLFSSAGALGEVLGPLVAGMLMQVVPQRKQITCQDTDAVCISGIQWTCTILGIIVLGTLVLFQTVVPNYQRARAKKIYKAV